MAVREYVNINLDARECVLTFKLLERPLTGSYESKRVEVAEKFNKTTNSVIRPSN